MRTLATGAVSLVAALLLPACVSSAALPLSAEAATPRFGALLQAGSPPLTATPADEPAGQAATPELQLLTVPHGAAATAPPADDGWQFALAPYLWAVSQKGDITAKGHKGEVDLGFDDILSNLDVALLLSAEARQGDTVLRLDQSYLAVSDEVKQGPVEIEASQRAYFATIKVGQALGDGPEAPIVFVGARYWNLGLDVELKAVGGPTLSSADGSQDWWDPLVAAEKRWELDDRWSLVAGADVGGFGVGDGSDSTWQAALLFSRKTDSGGSVVMGWRHLSIDRSDGSGPDRFEFDMRISGPLFGWAFRF